MDNHFPIMTQKQLHDSGYAGLETTKSFNGGSTGHGGKAQVKDRNFDNNN